MDDRGEERRGNWQERRLAPGEYVRRTLAAEVGVSTDTIRRWQEDGIINPIRKESGKQGQWVFDTTALRIAMRVKELQHHIKDVRLIILAKEFPEEFADWIATKYETIG